MGGGRDAGRRFNGATVSEIASHYSEKCGKWSYLTRKDARAAIRLDKGGEHVRPYECGTCRYWHVFTLPDQVIRGEHTGHEHYDRFTADPRLRLPRERVANARFTASRQLRYDMEAFAAAWADRVAGTNRASPVWVAQRRYAGELLAWLKDHLEQLAHDAAGDGFTDPPAAG